AGSAWGSSSGSGPWCRRRARTSGAAIGSGRGAGGVLGAGGWGGGAGGPTRTDRAKPGVKQSLLVEADGGPLAITIAGANVPDAQLLEATIDAIVLHPTDPR